MHEISHNLAFEKPIHNKLLGFFANLATVFPYYSLFQKYHMEHHQYQGVLGIDTDIPTELEKKIFVKSIFKKMIWVFFQLLFYAIRPLWIKPKIPGISEFINIICCIIFDFIIIYYFGFKSLSYLILSLFLGSGIHPVAGHFIAEHYVFQKGQETYSYYGPLNLICFNVGYHNEHHDFPRIPGVRLPLLKEIAPEFYNLPHYTSWTKVIWDYITNPNIGPYSRIVRSPNKKQN
jgi:sphingolipid delta-4 desaturase